MSWWQFGLMVAGFVVARLLVDAAKALYRRRRRDGRQWKREPLLRGLAMADQEITAYHCATQAAAALDNADGSQDRSFVDSQLGIAEGWRRLAETIAGGAPGVFAPDASADAEPAARRGR